METEFPREAAFDDDYLYFYEELLTPERTAAEVELVWKLLELEPGMELLDLACGHGRIANPLAERGVRVTGLDATPFFLDLARKDAAERAVWRSSTSRATCARCPGRSGSTASCAGSRRSATSATTRTGGCSAEAYRALRPGGLFAVEMNNLLRLLQVYAAETVTERGGDKMIDRHRFDIQTNRSLDERTIIRDGKERTFEFSVRMFTPAELRDWLLGAGFREAVAYGDDGEPLTPEHEGRRMTVVGRK